jgi:acyl-coenzyme A thioesterase PaaI-like protein
MRDGVVARKRDIGATRAGMTCATVTFSLDDSTSYARSRRVRTRVRRRASLWHLGRSSPFSASAVVIPHAPRQPSPLR